MNIIVLTTWLQAKLGRDEQGANLVEYILLVSLIALAVIGAVIFMRGQVIDKMNYAGSKISNTPNP
jgi:Flp pilus assembly pilin Flp